MGKVILEMSVSLDGFTSGSDVTVQEPMGMDGKQLHHWLFEGKTDADEKIIAAIFETSGAVIVGGNTYHIAIDDAWSGASPFNMPAFVVTQTVPAVPVTGFTYVTQGIEVALAMARRSAAKKNIWVMGGAQLAQSFISAGLLDEMHIHIVPLLLGKGTRLFDDIENLPLKLETLNVVPTPAATHISLQVLK